MVRQGIVMAALYEHKLDEQQSSTEILTRLVFGIGRLMPLTLPNFTTDELVYNDHSAWQATPTSSYSCNYLFYTTYTMITATTQEIAQRTQKEQEVLPTDTPAE